MHIRVERREDAPRIHDLHRAAFGSTFEGDIVDALRAAGVALISLVAVDEDEIVGHILFSPVTITGADGMRIVALGPIAALPDRQRRGIGSALVNAGLEQCRKSGAQAVFVVGHAEYYPRFGFIRAARFGISCASSRCLMTSSWSSNSSRVRCKAGREWSTFMRRSSNRK